LGLPGCSVQLFDSHGGLGPSRRQQHQVLIELWQSSVPELPLSASQVLSAIAVLLLVFVSGGVIYLSIIEWSDRRRRNALEIKRRK
jgi:hypothetical protein